MGRLIAIGVGCRAGASAEAIVELARDTLAAFAPLEGELRLCTLVDKCDEPGIVEASAALGAPLVALPLEALQAEAKRVLTPSPAAEARFGAPNVAEASALAGAGAGGRLLGARRVRGGVACAIAVSGGAP